MSLLRQIKADIEKAARPDESLWTVQALKERRERGAWWQRSIGPSIHTAYAIVVIIACVLAVVAMFALGGQSIL